MRETSLGELEKRIMEIIWKHEKSSVRDVLNELKGKKLAYTTVATIIQRLYDKGLLDRYEKDRGYIYSPKLSKESYSKRLAQTFVRKFINSFGNVAIASFVESIDTLPKKKRDYFLKLLENL